MALCCVHERPSLRVAACLACAQSLVVGGTLSGFELSGRKYVMPHGPIPVRAWTLRQDRPRNLRVHFWRRTSQTNNQQATTKQTPTNNQQQPTTNNQPPTAKQQQQPTNSNYNDDQQQPTNKKPLTTSNKQQATSNKQQTRSESHSHTHTNDEGRITSQPPTTIKQQAFDKPNSKQIANYINIRRQQSDILATRQQTTENKRGRTNHPNERKNHTCAVHGCTFRPGPGGFTFSSSHPGDVGFRV